MLGVWREGFSVFRSLSVFGLGLSGQHGPLGAPWALKGGAPSLESDMSGRFLIDSLQPCRGKTEANPKGLVSMSEVEPRVYHFLAG